ncbi:MAG: hypothetical protein JWP88_2346, partial [Flaviaesturariibacter sp.]|nr:hypothetical protein [Flaviaesturariibacter sp.]
MHLKKVLFISLTVGLFAFELGAQQPVLLTGIVKKQLIDSISKVLNRNYVYPNKAIVISNAIRQKQLNNGYNVITDAQQLANELTKDMRKVWNDSHLSIHYDPDLEKRIRMFEAPLRKEEADV